MKVRQIIKRIEANGWYRIKAKGGHRQYKHPTRSGRVTVPGRMNADLDKKTERSILKQAGLDDYAYAFPPSCPTTPPAPRTLPHRSLDHQHFPSQRGELHRQAARRGHRAFVLPGKDVDHPGATELLGG